MGAIYNAFWTPAFAGVTVRAAEILSVKALGPTRDGAGLIGSFHNCS